MASQNSVYMGFFLLFCLGLCTSHRILMDLNDQNKPQEDMTKGATWPDLQRKLTPPTPPSPWKKVAAMSKVGVPDGLAVGLNGYGYGSGTGTGSGAGGVGVGSGSGSGYGSGSGNGVGSGYGHGEGRGIGSGNNGGSGYGEGYGYGSGSGGSDYIPGANGAGEGRGIGSGSDGGYGYGEGQGSGSGGSKYVPGIGFIPGGSGVGYGHGEGQGIGSGNNGGSGYGEGYGYGSGSGGGNPVQGCIPGFSCPIVPLPQVGCEPCQGGLGCEYPPGRTAFDDPLSKAHKSSKEGEPMALGKSNESSNLAHGDVHHEANEPNMENGEMHH